MDRELCFNSDEFETSPYGNCKVTLPHYVRRVTGVKIIDYEYSILRNLSYEFISEFKELKLSFSYYNASILVEFEPDIQYIRNEKLKSLGV